MMRPLTGFIGPAYLLESPNVDCQRSVNLYTEIDELGTGKNQEVASLVVRPGLSLYVTVGARPIRSQHVTGGGRYFVVSGDSLYEISSGVATLKGTLSTGAGSVSMADSSIQLLIVDGAKGYVYDLEAETFSEISSAGFPNGATVAQCVDSTFIVNKADSQQFQISAVNDATSWDALDIASKEGKSDNLLTIAVIERELYLLGSQTAEIWWNSGAAGFPFERRAFIEYGVLAPNAVVTLGGAIVGPARNDRGQDMIAAITSGSARRLSTFALEQKMRSYGDISAATAWGYEDGSHVFYAINFPNAPTTWVCDLSSSHWHERTNLSGGKEARHWPENHAFYGGNHLVGDYRNGNIYKIDSSVFADNGEVFQWKRTAPHIAANGARVKYLAAQLDMEAGRGLSSGQGSDPQVFLRWSDDGGHVWSNEHWASAGKKGQYDKRVKWNRLGASRDRVFEVSGSDPVGGRLISLFLDSEVMRH